MDLTLINMFNVIFLIGHLPSYCPYGHIFAQTIPFKNAQVDFILRLTFGSIDDSINFFTSYLEVILSALHVLSLNNHSFS